MERQKKRGGLNKNSGNDENINLATVSHFYKSSFSSYFQRSLRGMKKKRRKKKEEREIVIKKYFA